MQDCYDSIAMFLCIQLILRFQILCHKRCVPALDKWVFMENREFFELRRDILNWYCLFLFRYWDSLQAVIWPRFELIFRMNIQSVRDCDPNKFNKSLAPHYVRFFHISIVSLKSYLHVLIFVVIFTFHSKSNLIFLPHCIQLIDTYFPFHQFQITRRYAEFSAAVVGLSEQFPNELVSRLLLDLQNEVECFIMKMAGNFSSRKEQLIFLINNYDMILNVLLEHTRDNSKEAETFRQHLSTRSTEYVEEILSPHFGGIMTFVKDMELQIEKNPSGNVTYNEHHALQLVTKFSSNWKKAIEDIDREITVSFQSYVTGSTLLQLALASLVQYYHRFHKLLNPNERMQLKLRKSTNCPDSRIKAYFLSRFFYI